MGAVSLKQIKYSVEIGFSKNPLETGNLRSSAIPDILIDNFFKSKLNNCWELFQMGVSCNPSGACLGKRKIDSNGDLGVYTWMSYKHVSNFAVKLGSSLLNLNLTPEITFSDEAYTGAQKLRLLGLFAANCIEWFVCEQAANAFNITLVPLYSNYDQKALKHIIKQTNLTTICGHESSFTKLLALVEDFKFFKNFICFDNQISESTISLAKAKSINIHSYKKLIRCKNILPISPGSLDSVSTLCYTSGTTGVPKGAILTHGNFVSVVAAVIQGPLSASRGLNITNNDVHLSYLPLAHVFERTVCNVLLCLGASIGIYSGDITKLLDDVRVLRPTVFISVPQLFNRINKKVFGNLKEKSNLAQYLFSKGLSTKLKTLRFDGSPTHSFWDPIVFNKIKQLMGGRLRYMLVGGAPLEEIIQERMKILFSAPLCEGYGLTESLGTSFISMPFDPMSGHVGGVIPCIEFKLVSVVDMNHRVDDKPPRGEIYIRGPAICKGYFMARETTAEVFDDEGWFHTGDIGTLTSNGALKIIDRRKNIFKLAQGDYVALEKIEAIYLQSLTVSQIFAYGDPSRFALVGIVVPNEEFAYQWAIQNNVSTSLDVICTDQKFQQAIYADFCEIAKLNNLKSIEQLKKIYLYPEQFTTENNLLTPTSKLKRKEAEKFFKNQIDEMYNILNEKQ